MTLPKVKEDEIGAPGPTVSDAALSAVPQKDFSDLPMVVDLDGTLVRSNLSLESFFAAIRNRPSIISRFPIWLFRGRAVLKRHLAIAGMPDVTPLPYRADLLSALCVQRSVGRRLVLVTGADQAIADAVSKHLGIFETAIGSDGRILMVGRAKARKLVARYGNRGFDYAGDVADDLPVWRVSRNAIVTGRPATSYRRIEKTTPVIEVYADPADVWLHYLKALRPQQWIKNLLVFLPLVAAHRLFEPAPLMKVVLAFAAFTACASSVYLLNDLLDLSSDRHHPHKRKRMLASGAIGTGGACWLMGSLLVSAIAIGFALSPLFLLVLLSYYLMTLAYSLGLKDRVVLDVLILAGGYAARVAAGAVAIGIAPSSWMLAFCVFLFFSLALIKRFSELVLRRRLDGPKAQARAYVIDDAGVIAAQGIASGYLAVLVLALYTTTDLIQSLYGRYWLFWGICVLLLYWISYLWLAADRGRIEDDPVSFAIEDRVSRNLLLGIAAIGLAAT